MKKRVNTTNEKINIANITQNDNSSDVEFISEVLFTPSSNDVTKIEIIDLTTTTNKKDSPEVEFISDILATVDVPATRSYQVLNIDANSKVQFPHAPNQNDNSMNSNFCTYPPPSSNISQNSTQNNSPTSSIVNQYHENNDDKSTSELMLKYEVTTDKSPNSASFSEYVKPRILEMPLSIAAKDPQLRDKIVRVVYDSGRLEMTLPAEKQDNKKKLLSQNTSVEKPRTSTEGKLTKFTCKTIAHTNQHNDGKSQKRQDKGIDQKRMYKSPLLDFHGSQGISCYSRNIANSPERNEFRSYKAHFRRRNSDVSSNTKHERHRDRRGQYPKPNEPYRKYRQSHSNYYYKNKNLPNRNSSNRHSQHSPTASLKQKKINRLTDLRSDHYFKKRKEDISHNSKGSAERRPSRLKTPPDYGREKIRYSHENIHSTLQNPKREKSTRHGNNETHSTKTYENHHFKKHTQH